MGIEIIQDIASTLLDKVYDDFKQDLYKDDPNKKELLKKKAFEAHRELFENFLYNHYNTYWHSKYPPKKSGKKGEHPDEDKKKIVIGTYQKNLITHSEQIYRESTAYVILIILCKYLLGEPNQADPAAPKRNQLTRRELIEDYFLRLKELGIISETSFDQQVRKWDFDNESNWGAYFSLYYIKKAKDPLIEKDEPDVAVMKVNKNWKKVKLEFYEGEAGKRTSKSVDIGDVIRAATDANLFISVKNEVRNIPSLLALIAAETAKIEEVDRFEGCFCSVLQSDCTTPVSGKVILQKHKREKTEHIAELGTISDNIRAELINEVLSYQRLKKPMEYLNWVGLYIGFWYFVNEKEQSIRPIHFQIEEDRTCRFTDSDGKQQTGIVHWLGPESKILKCSFDERKNANSDYRIVMVFDISNKNDKKVTFFDGIYAGEREREPKPMAGRIRLYRANDSYNDIDVNPVDFEVAKDKIPQIADELIDHFWGEINSSRNFLQPNRATFKRFFDPDPEKDSRVSALVGEYFLYKLDSRKEHINQYPLSIKANGTVTYSLDVRDDDGNLFKHTYSGRYDKVHDCLVLTINNKDNSSHRGMFIFFVGNAVNVDVRQIAGTYTSLSAAETVPVAGRCLLTRQIGEPNIYGPIKVFSPEYYSISERNKQMFRLITGAENNLIKSSKKINNVSRKYQYDDIFFQYAVNKDQSPVRKAEFLRLALEHGFDDIDQLSNELNEGGRLHYLHDLINAEFTDRITVAYKTFRVESKIAGEIWVFEGRKYI